MAMSSPRSLVFLLALLFCASLGCAEDPVFTADLTVSPTSPLAGQPFALIATIERASGSELGDVAVTVSASNGTQQIAEVVFASVEAANTYEASDVVFAEAGAWNIKLRVDDGKAREKFAYLLHIPEPRCDDDVSNGNETDVDCGGDACTGCLHDAACNSADDCLTGICSDGLCGLPPGGLIGYQDGSPDSVSLTLITDQQLSLPRDLDFNPNEENEIWVANYANDSLTVVENAGKPDQSVQRFEDYTKHFLERVTAISFAPTSTTGPTSTFGTCGESRNTYDDLDHANDYMGPVLWPADTEVFTAEECNNVAHHICDAANVHLDMLHSTPLCMGIASTGGNAFYAFGGLHDTIFWYDFGVPHVHGGDDHTDGDAYVFANVSVRRSAGVPSNMIFDFNTAWLYVADSGNGRVFRMRQDNVQIDQQLPTHHADGELHQVQNVTIEMVIPSESGLVATPSGLDLHGDELYVADYGTGMIHAVTSTGTVIRSLDTGLGAGSLGGLTIGPDDRIYFVDMKLGRILRIDP